jgi:dihydrofolate reductase
MLKAIAAQNNKGYIGRGGRLMWRSKEDFKHFKSMTMGGILICGRVTYEQDLGGKPLKGRDIIVIGQGYSTPWQAITQAHSIQEAHWEHACQPDVIKSNGIPTKKDIWVIGGASIYEMFMPFINEFHLSVINDDQEGDRKLVWRDYRGQTISYNFEADEQINVNSGTDNSGQ